MPQQSAELQSSASFLEIERKRKTCYLDLKKKQSNDKAEKLHLASLSETYLNLKPKFLEVFNKFDKRKRGYLDRADFDVFEKEFTKIMNDTKLSDDQKKKATELLLNKLGLIRYCCRMRMISYVDQVNLII